MYELTANRNAMRCELVDRLYFFAIHHQMKYIELKWYKPKHAHTRPKLYSVVRLWQRDSMTPNKLSLIEH